MSSRPFRFRKGLIITMAAALLLFAACLLVFSLLSEENSPPLPNSQTFGIIVIDIDDEEAQSSFHVPEKGVYILAVEEDSPASLADIQPGDRILQINGAGITNSTDFLNHCSENVNGKTVSLVLARGEEQKTIQVEINLSSGKEEVP